MGFHDDDKTARLFIMLLVVAVCATVVVAVIGWPYHIEKPLVDARVENRTSVVVTVTVVEGRPCVETEK